MDSVYKVKIILGLSQGLFAEYKINMENNEVQII